MNGLLSDCVGLAMSIGLILIVACCVAPIARVFGATGRKRNRKKKAKMQKRGGDQIGRREAICMALIVILFAISLVSGTMKAIISSLLGK